MAKILSYGFIDTDVLIQINQQKPLQQIIDEHSHLHLRRIEEEQITRININRHVIATGGSAAYSEKAMTHLMNISTIIFLKADYEVIKKRIHNFETRGIAKGKNQTFRQLFDERQILYNKYAELTLNCNTLDQEEIAEIIAKKIRT